ncbi:hypothetical protein PUN28_008038 [Cardiocondyla obscurior]
MQTAACGPCSGTSQGGGPFTHLCQPDTYIVNHQCTPGTSQPITNPCQPVFQNLLQTHPGCSQLPQNILDQIHAYVSATPIFILPGNCQPSPASQQQHQPPMPPSVPQITSSPPAAHSPNGLNSSAACYPPPPSFYPYPIPLPYGNPFARTHEVVPSCGCCRKGDADSTEIRNVLRAGCRFDATDPDEHRCTPTLDDTICSKRNCPSSLHLQALASQFLSMQGIIPCAATRLVLRKVPGSNVTTTMEDTMMRAQKAISVLTKDQLLSESRNAQQVNALINLHMTANPPPNVIPILTLVQLKMNLLKAQVEALINQKIMEIQGVGVEVETDLIDPTVLSLKSDAELRDFLSALRKKECDERVNVNFSPYRSQRAIAETRLRNIQNKICQVEAEFDRRRCAMFPAPTLSSHIVQQFSRSCYSARFEDPRRLYNTLPPDTSRSPDPFTYVKPRSPRRLLLKPCTGKPETVTRTVPETGTPENLPKNLYGDKHVDHTKEQPVTSNRQHFSADNCTCCDRTSEESLDEAKKKLQLKIVEINAATINDIVELEDSEILSLMKLTSNVCVKVDMMEYCGTPCNAKRKVEARTNVADNESKTLTESKSNTVTFNEKIDAKDEVQEVVEIQSCDQTMDQQKFESLSNFEQFKKQAEDEIAILKTDKAIKEHDIEIKSFRDISPQEADREKVRAKTILKVANKNPISTIDAMVERNTSQVPISKNKERSKFHIVSLMTNIVYDKSNKYERKRTIEKETATSKREKNVTTDPDIEKLNNRSSIHFLRSAVAYNITGKDHSKSVYPKKLDIPNLSFDHEWQITFTEDKDTTTTLLKANIFPPFKNLHKYVTDNEKNGDDVGTYPSPIMKEGITATKRLSRCNDVTGSILETLCRNNVFYHPDVECEGNLIAKLFSVTRNCMITFINKITAMIRKLLKLIRDVIIHNDFNTDVLRSRHVLISDYSEIISKSYSLSIDNTSHFSSGLNYKTLIHDFCDTLRTFTRKSFNKIRKINHLIIENQKNDTRYLLIGTSHHNRDLILTRNLSHLSKSYKVRKSLLIHSRLKNSLNSQNYPFSFFKTSEKFWTLSEIIKTNAINGKISGMREYDNEFEEEILNEHSHDNIKSNNVSVEEHTIVDNNAADNELVISVHNYLELQPKINTSIYENRNAYLLISNN